jgi:hypothetical protein
MCAACSLRRARASEAIRRVWLQNRSGSLRSSAAWVVAQAMSNLVSSSSHHAAQQVFFEDHAGLDGLAEPDFVGEQHAAAKLLEHLAHGLDLVPEGFDAAQMRQAEQLVEALREAEMGKALA